ncbi:MAG: polysaccharide biosynthesis/export family protein [Paludibacteraceae bacterium]|nr:polysaccharide biosynthesis/export family protein [Paludibacteraceae bacterium]MBQ7996356.1 polysaccharide biosynthesis/export family protein [Paludibacteraceae bacterium]
MHKTIRHLLVLTLFPALLAGCVTQKQMTYMSDARAEKAEEINASFKPQSEMVIRSGDALTIFVSALDQEAVVPFNLPMVVYAKPGEEQPTTTPSMQYYIVDESGDIEFPVLGKLRVAGLRRNEVENLVKKELESQLVNPTVHVNLIGAKVSVMGEVARPGQIPITSGRVTVLDALAAAGDLTPYGRRDNVLVSREVDGKMQMARLDLRSADIYNSPYFFLQQNDVVYVSPNKVRAVSSTNAGLWFSMVSTVASAATVIVTIVSVTKK